MKKFHVLLAMLLVSCLLTGCSSNSDKKESPQVEKMKKADEGQ